MSEFGSIVDAVRCAAEIQPGMNDRNTDIREDKRISFRIGINLGDVIIDRSDIYGDQAAIISHQNDAYQRVASACRHGSRA
jgi:class 3 adenylate cyclase